MSKHVMTQSEKEVRDRIGGGGSCWAGFGNNPSIYRIWSRALPGGTDPQSALLGVGRTPELAWDDALRKLHEEVITSSITVPATDDDVAKSDEARKILDAVGYQRWEQSSHTAVEVISADTFHFDARGHRCDYWTNGIHIVSQGVCRCGAEFILARVTKTKGTAKEVSNG
jgi:hypothetical protein